MTHNDDETIVPEPGEVAVLDVPEPLGPPVDMSDEEIAAAKRQAHELVLGLKDSTGSRQLAAVDEITGSARQAQLNAGRQLELARTRLATFLDEGGASKEIATGMVDLRVALNRIDPNLGQKGFLRRTVGALPLVNNNALVRTLQKIALRFESVSKQITVIETKLREGRALLDRDNVELRMLYEDVEAQQRQIQRAAYVGELLVQELTDALAATEESRDRERIEQALHAVAMRVVDLRSMEEVHVQFFVGIELTRQNNSRLGEAVDRTVTMATNVVTIGLAIQAALVRQKRVMEATQRTRQYIGDLIAANAAAIKQHTEEIGDLYNEPVVAMEVLVQAHNDLMAALDTASQLRVEGIERAKQSIEQIKELTPSLAGRVDGLLEEGEERTNR
jgi:uncharacterized protein YaaN involved in tellurite resistance